ncbi:acyl-CoA dehydrogenase family protein [Hyalangium versicolor]|uniref:acyl-CoA dehydrogenase family protein n=1 Tax=Hyalangium versicolor TaxID=2861190 RepID=UPI001CC9018C|nr:acyl-CoA dehydrogenase family protein [Hyalangium versicolor]
MTPHEDPSAPIDFRCSPVAEPYVSAARAVASAIRDLSSTERAHLWAAVALVRELELESVLPELESREDVPVLLFHMAELLGHANLPAAWRGLSSAPARAAELPPLADLVAIPNASATQWTSWQPMVDPACPPTIALFDPNGPTLAVPVSRGICVSGLTCSRKGGLLGFPFGEVLTCSLQPGVTRSDIGMRPLAAGAWDTYVRAQMALLCGLIVGATRRLVDEAYAYARTRQSAGKPITQHQAVAVRLADLALNQEALSLYLTASIEQCEPPGMKGGIAEFSVGHVGDLSFRIARDAVQTAAGHGYVEGLPFRRLFEQVRTLTVMINAVKAGALMTAAPC